MTGLCLASCGTKPQTATEGADAFNYVVDQFADVQILRYRVPDFETLSLQQKLLVYYLSQAAVEGRDILYDQNGRHNLCIRRTLEAVYENYEGDRSSADFKALETYLKQVWMGNGIHHHYSMDKFVPAFSQAFFAQAVQGIDPAKLPLAEGETAQALVEKLTPVIFDPAVMPKRVNQAAGQDLIATSACNYYEGVTQREVEQFYDKMKDPADATPVPYGLNSKLVKRDGRVQELTYKVGGLYSPAIERITGWLEKASSVAENDQQRKVIDTLIDYYRTGNLETYDEYSIEWVKDLASQVDFVNGFTETYGDPLGLKGSWESIVNFKNVEATKRTEIISIAQLFEDHSHLEPEFRMEKVKGVSSIVF